MAKGKDNKINHLTLSELEKANGLDESKTVLDDKFPKLHALEDGPVNDDPEYASTREGSDDEKPVSFDKKNDDTIREMLRSSNRLSDGNSKVTTPELVNKLLKKSKGFDGSGYENTDEGDIAKADDLVQNLLESSTSPMAKLLLKGKKKLDPNERITEEGVVVPISPVTGLGGSKILAKETNEVYKDILKKGKLDAFSHYTTFDGQAYDTQTGSEIFKKSSVGFFNNAVAGFLKNAGSNDLGVALTTISGSHEGRTSNLLLRLADEITESNERNNHIFQNGSPFTGAKVGQMISSFGFTFGIMGESFAEMYLTGGASTELSLAKAAKTAKTIAAQAIKKNAKFGIYQGIKETLINSLETQKQVEDFYTSKGYSIEDANKKGAEAAALHFKIEAFPSMALNALQFAMISKMNPLKSPELNSGLSGNVEFLADSLVDGIENKVKRKAAKYALGFGSEAIEEGGQTAYGKEAAYRIQVADKLVKKQNLFERTMDAETLESAIMGGFGGSFFQLGGQLLSNASERISGVHAQKKKLGKAYDSFIARTSSNISKHTKELDELNKNGSSADINIKKNDIAVDLAVEAMTLDHMMGNELALDGLVSNLSETIEKMKEPSSDEQIKELKELGYSPNKDGSFSDHIETLENIKDKALSIRESVEKNLGRSINFESALNLTLLEDREKTLEKYALDNDEKVTELKLKHNLNNDELALSLLVLNYWKKDIKSLPKNKRREAAKLIVKIKEIEAKVKDENNDEYDIDLDKVNSVTSSEDASDLLVASFSYEAAMKEHKKTRAERVRVSDINEQKNDLVKNRVNKIKKRKSRWRNKKKTKKVSKTKEIQNNESLKESISTDESISELENKIIEETKKVSEKKGGDVSIIVEELIDEKEVLETSKAKLDADAAVGGPVEPTETDYFAAGTNLFGTSNLQEESNSANIPIETILVKKKQKDLGFSLDDSEPSMNELLDSFGDNNNSEEKKETNKLSDEKSDIADEFLSAGNNLFGDFAKRKSSVSVPKAVSDKFKKLTKSYYEQMLVENKSKPTFLAFVNELIDAFGEQKAEEMFNLLASSWVSNGYGTVNKDSAYNVLFNKKDQIANEFLSVFESAKEEQSENEVKETTSKKEIKSLKKSESNKKEEIKRKYGVARYLSLEYVREVKVDKNGKEYVEIKTVGKEIWQGKLPDSDKILHPDKMLPGTKLELVIPNDIESHYVMNWEDDSSKGELIKFGQWMSIHNVEQYIASPGEDNLVLNPEWVKKAPIVARNSDGVYFYIEDIDSHNVLNTDGSNSEVARKIKEHRKRITEIREEFFLNGNKNIVITNKTEGVFETVDNNELVPISETMNKPLFGVGTIHGEVVHGHDSILPEGSIIINEDEVNDGISYELRETAIKGKYRAFKTVKRKLNEDEALSVAIAFRIFFHSKLDSVSKGLGFSSDSASKYIKTLKRITEEVSSLNGLDLTSIGGFYEYIKMFFPMVEGRFTSPEGVLSYVNSNDNLPDGSLWISSNSNVHSGAIMIGIKGEKIGNSDYLFLSPNGINDKDKNGNYYKTGYVDSFIKLIMKHAVNRGLNMSKASLKRDTPVAIMKNISGKVTVINKGSYKSYMEENNKSNIKSYPAKGSETKRFTFVQPVVSYKFENDTKPNTDSDTKTEEKEVRTSKEIVRSNHNTELSPEAIASLVSARNLLIESGDRSVETINSLKSIANKLGEKFNSYDLAKRISKDERPNKIKSTLLSVPGLSEVESEALSEHLLVLALEEIKKTPNDAEIDARKVLSNRHFRDIIYNKINEFNDQIAELRKNEMDFLIPALKAKVDNYTLALNNWKIQKKILIDNIEKYGSVSLSNDSSKRLDQLNIKDKNHSKLSIESNPKTSASAILKRFFYGIEETKDGKVVLGPFGLPKRVPYDTAFSTIQSILGEKMTPESDFNSVLEVLRERGKDLGWLNSAVEKLENSDEQTKNAFLYEIVLSPMKSKFLMQVSSENGENVSVYSSNSSSISLTLKSAWKSNWSSSELNRSSGGEKVFLAELLLKKINEFRLDPDLVEVKDLKFLFDKFGISLSLDASSDIIMNGLKVGRKNVSLKRLLSSKVANKNSNSVSIFNVMESYLDRIVEQKGENANIPNNVFSNIQDAINNIAKIESRYRNITTTSSFRDGGKTIAANIPPKLATDRIRDLKTNMENFKNDPYSSSSYMLEILEKEELFNDKFDVEHLSTVPIKIAGELSFGDKDITKLSPNEREKLKVGFLTSEKQGTVFHTINGIRFKIGRMLFPTMSDKSTMTLISTAVLDINKSSFVSRDGKLTMKDNLVDFLYTQLVLPEAKRIFNSTDETDTDYDFASKIFWFIPKINSLKGDTTTMLNKMVNRPDVYTLKDFEKEFMPQIRNVIEEFVDAKVEERINRWLSSGVIELNNVGEIVTSPFNENYLDESRIGKTNSEKDKLRILAHDVVLNYLIGSSNIHQLFAGDIAFFAKGNIKSLFKDGNPLLPKNDSSYIEASKMVSTNLTKRLAYLIAPGKTLAGSNNETYFQVFADDTNVVSNNIEEIMKVHLSKEDYSVFKDKFDELNNSENEIEYNDALDFLKNRFSELSGYFDIESTDGQELTTEKEHVDILFKQGRLDPLTHKNIMDKIEKRKNLGPHENLPDNLRLTKEELRTVLQPIKPVVTGFIWDGKRNRPYYIKSSSYPLFRELTGSFELDSLRKKLESIEKETGKNVRLAFKSAVKIGYKNSSSSAFDNKGNFNHSIEFEPVTMKRSNFRIQQDTPFKAEREGVSKVSLVTQAFKMLLSGDALTISDFDYNNKKYSGEELVQVYTDIIKRTLKTIKNELLDDLHLDKNMKPKDLIKHKKAVMNLIKNEAKKRGYPNQVVSNLEFKEILDTDGNLIDLEPSIPLWFTPNSNKIESLLLSVISKKLIKLKIPGSSYILGSSMGYKYSSIEDVDESDVIFTDKFDGESLKGWGKKNHNQVFVSSKFKTLDGKLIDLIVDGKPNPQYVEVLPNGKYMLKKGVIDDELLSFTSNRIPNSGHVSMSQMEIAGFIPSITADLIILPDNLVAQKGIDYDIDKEFAYHLNTFVNPTTGKIEVLKESHRQEFLKLMDRNDKVRLGGDLSFLEDLFDIDFLEEDISNDYMLKKLNSKFDKMLLENEFIKLNSSVLSNDKMKKSISGTLSMDVAIESSNIINDKISENKDDSNFSVIDDLYQSDKLSSGASGKLAIAVYSNYLVMQALVESSNTNLEHESSIIFGTLESRNKLGLKDPLIPNGRSPYEILGERQNLGTDNQNVEVLDKVNVNKYTINVDAMLAALGFDKVYVEQIDKEVMLPFLFLKQESIMKYVDLLSKMSEDEGKYVSNKEKHVFDYMLEEYIKTIREEEDLNDSTDEEIYSFIESQKSLLSGSRMYHELTSPSAIAQAALLINYIELHELSKSFGGLIKVVNVNSSELGISFNEFQSRVDGFNDILSYNKVFKNASTLIGDVYKIGDSRAKGTRIGKLIVDPKTSMGHMLVSSYSLASSLWSDYYPDFKSEFKGLLNDVNYNGLGTFKKVKLMNDVISSFRSFLVSSKLSGLFEDATEKRKEMFFGDESFPIYLQKLLNDSTKTSSVLRSNKLLSRFGFTVDESFSKIVFDGSKGDNYNEDHLYNSLVSLYNLNMPLPSPNGNENSTYTTKDLVFDLISYSMLSGWKQEAIEFTKYVPIEILNEFEIFEDLNNYTEEDIYNFSIQFLQNNPKYATRGSLKYITNTKYLNEESNSITDTGKGLSGLEMFSLDPLSFAHERYYFEMKNKTILVFKTGKNYHLFLNNGKGLFTKIDSAGIFGMPEYNREEKNVSTNIPSLKLLDSASINDTMNALNEQYGLNIEDYEEFPTNSIGGISEEFSPSPHEQGFEEDVDISELAAGNSLFYSESGNEVNNETTTTSPKKETSSNKSLLEKTKDEYRNNLPTKIEKDINNIFGSYDPVLNVFYYDKSMTALDSDKQQIIAMINYKASIDDNITEIELIRKEVIELYKNEILEVKKSIKNNEKLTPYQKEMIAPLSDNNIFFYSVLFNYDFLADMPLVKNRVKLLSMFRENNNEVPVSKLIGLLDSSKDLSSSEKSILELIKNNVDIDLKISLVDFVKDFGVIAAGAFIYKGEQFYNKNGGKSGLVMLDKSSMSEDANINETILHELIHSVLSEVMNQYYDRDGNVVSDNIPENVQDLFDLYLEAKGEFESSNKKDPNDIIKYGLSNINEFITHMMTNNEFQNRFNVKSKNNKNFIERFASIVFSIFNGSKGKTITNNSNAVILSIIDSINNSNSLTINKNESETEIEIDIEDGQITDINIDDIYDDFSDDTDINSIPDLAIRAKSKKELVSLIASDNELASKLNENGYSDIRISSILSSKESIVKFDSVYQESIKDGFLNTGEVLSGRINEESIAISESLVEAMKQNKKCK